MNDCAISENDGVGHRKKWPNLVAFLHKAPLAHVLRPKELIICSHGLLDAINLDALQNDSALYHYVQEHKYTENIADMTLTVTYLALIGDVLCRQNEKSAAISHMKQARDHVQIADKVMQGYILQLFAYT
jgi:hypothetical protein